MTIETIYKIWCPKCTKHMYVNNGDTDDLTGMDVTGVQCPYCGEQFKLGDDLDDDDEDPDYTIASKQLK